MLIYIKENMEGIIPFSYKENSFQSFLVICSFILNPAFTNAKLCYVSCYNNFYFYSFTFGYTF